jgi:glycine cleavage system regulatory protein
MKTLIIGLVGADKPGLIDSIAQKVYTAEGNWLSSNFSHMAGQFAGFAEVQVPIDAIDTLTKTLSNIPDLHIQVHGGDKTKETDSSLVSIDVVGNDRKGIVQELSSTLNSFELNIVKFESRCESAPNWGSILFKAKAIIHTSEQFDLDELQEALENIANDIVVELTRH